jgi:hypothetical protein
MKMTIEMPQIKGCAIVDCAYNLDKECHARAITIGDGVHPGCDTAYFNQGHHVKESNRVAGVGACKVSGCTHNVDLECSASNISVGFRNQHVNCLTYSAA